MGRARNFTGVVTTASEHMADRFDGVFGSRRSSSARPDAAENAPLRVWAGAHSDDFVVELEFDATAYMEQAPDDELMILASENWGGEYAGVGWQVAEFYRESETSSLFSYLESDWGRRAPAPRFECHVDSNQGRAWLAAYRPHLLS